MKKIVFLLVSLLAAGGLIIYLLPNSSEEEAEETEPILETGEVISQEEKIMEIRISDGSNEVVYALNESEAARDLYEQLPLSLEVSNFSNNEKIFYPSNELDISDATLASSGQSGILAYYAPWGDVVLFYDKFNAASDLYILGEAIEGKDAVSNLSGQIEIEKVEE